MAQGLYSAGTLVGLKPGDVIEAGKLFPALTDEPLTWEFLGRLNGEWQFRVSCCEVYLGHAKCYEGADKKIIGSMMNV